MENEGFMRRLQPTLEEAQFYIANLDFSQIIEKMVSHQGWLKKDVIAISELYKDYLFLQKKYGNNYEIVPSEEVDEFWHNHILDTKKYQEDCNFIFGCYLNHYPYFGMDESSDENDLNKAYEKTLELYKKEFGSDRFKYKVTSLKSRLIRILKLVVS